MSDDDRDNPHGLWLPRPVAFGVNVEYRKDATAEEMRRQRAEIARLRAEQAERDKLSAEQIIAKYYMRHGRNKKLTLRQHIKDTETTLSEGYIRKVKVVYDKRHKARKGR